MASSVEEVKQQQSELCLGSVVAAHDLPVASAGGALTPKRESQELSDSFVSKGESESSEKGNLVAPASEKKVDSPEDSTCASLMSEEGSESGKDNSVEVDSEKQAQGASPDDELERAMQHAMGVLPEDVDMGPGHMSYGFRDAAWIEITWPVKGVKILEKLKLHAGPSEGTYYAACIRFRKFMSKYDKQESDPPSVKATSLEKAIMEKGCEIDYANCDEALVAVERNAWAVERNLLAAENKGLKKKHLTEKEDLEKKLHFQKQDTAKEKGRKANVEKALQECQDDLAACRKHSQVLEEQIVEKERKHEDLSVEHAKLKKEKETQDSLNKSLALASRTAEEEMKLRIEILEAEVKVFRIRNSDLQDIVNKLKQNHGASIGSVASHVRRAVLRTRSLSPFSGE